MNKALAYEVATMLPLDVFDKLRSDETPNGMQDVCRVLVDSHLPGWIYYAVNESDHTINGYDVKVPRYLDEDVILEVATKYAETENPIINLNTPGSHNWMSDDPMKPVREQFEEKYETAKQSVAEVLADVFVETESMDVDHELCREWADAIVDGTDMLSWALTEKEFTGEVTARAVVETYVRRLDGWDVGQAYLDWVGDDTEYNEYLRTAREFGDEFDAAVEELEFASTEGYTPSMLQILPRDESRLNEADKAMKKLREDGLFGSR